MRKAFIQELIKQSRINDNIYLLSADVGYNLIEPFRDEFPDRFINVGIAEQSMIGIASGLAMQCKKVFCYSLGNFPTLRCLEQIRNDVCYHDLDVKIVNSGAGLYYGTLGSSHHATEDIAVMRALPNMTVISPCDPRETAKAMEYCFEENTPCYLRLQGSNDEVLYSFYEGIMSACFVHWHKDAKISVISSGAILGEVLKAAKLVGSKINVLSIPVVKPIDVVTISTIAGNSIITVEEHNLNGGLGSAVAEVLCDCGFNTRLTRIGLHNKFCKEVGSQEYLRKLNGLDAESIASKIKEVLR